jgi:hypothetical protein
MFALGVPLGKGQARYIFAMVDRDGSGSISEREFCEYWMMHGVQQPIVQQTTVVHHAPGPSIGFHAPGY